MHLRHAITSLCLLASCVAAPLPASAAPGIDPGNLKAAAEEFDAGRRAYKLGHFEDAAIHFENAFRDAPRPEALRMAIKARKEAGQLARSATLCVKAQTLYPDDADTARLTESVLVEVAPKLQKVTVRCEPSCNLSFDDKLMTDQPVSTQVLYAAAGAHRLVAGWSNERTQSRALDATEGTSVEVGFKAPVDAAPDVRIQAHTPTAPTQAAPTPAAPPPDASPRRTSSSGGLPPVVFFIGAGATAVLGGVAIWSGIDTRNNPGPDTVRRACVGLGPDCPEYQDGIAKERRTNYLWVGTAAIGVTTGLIAIFTDWGGAQKAPSGRGARVMPVVGLSEGWTVGATGRF